MAFDLSLLQNAFTARPSRTTPNLRPGALQMHEILGGRVGNTTPIVGAGYFVAWAAGGLITPNAGSVPGEGRPGEAVSTPPSVTVQSPKGPVQGFPIRFRVTKGGGVLNADSSTVVETVTDAKGLAAVYSWTLGPQPGVNEVVAEGFGLNKSFQVSASSARPDSNRRS